MKQDYHEQIKYSNKEEEKHDVDPNQYHQQDQSRGYKYRVKNFTKCQRCGMMSQFTNQQFCCSCSNIKTNQIRQQNDQKYEENMIEHPISDNNKYFWNEDLNYRTNNTENSILQNSYYRPNKLQRQSHKKDVISQTKLEQHKKMTKNKNKSCYATHIFNILIKCIPPKKGYVILKYFINIILVVLLWLPLVVSYTIFIMMYVLFLFIYLLIHNGSNRYKGVFDNWKRQKKLIYVCGTIVWMFGIPLFYTLCLLFQLSELLFYGKFCVQLNNDWHNFIQCQNY